MTQPFNEADQLLFSVAFELGRAIGVRAIDLTRVTSLNAQTKTHPHPDTALVGIPGCVLDAGTRVVFAQRVELSVEIAGVVLDQLEHLAALFATGREELRTFDYLRGAGWGCAGDRRALP